jgi:hypothetical protein
VGVLITLLLLFGFGASLWLARRATRVWRWEVSGAAYGLPVEYRSAVLWAAAALVTALFVLAGLVQPDPPARHAGQVVLAHLTSRVTPRRTPTPRPFPRPVASAPALVADRPFRVAGGNAFGGVWWQGTVAGNVVRVWLPPGYVGRGRALPVVVADSADVPGLAAALGSGASWARSFVVVDPGRGADGPALRRAVEAKFRVVADPRGWGVLGVGSRAADAVQAALAAPDRYAAGVGVDGRYDAVLPVARDGARVLLVAVWRDRQAVNAAEGLRRELMGVAPVRIACVPAAGQGRVREYRRVVAYFGMVLRGPGTPATRPSG